MVITIKVGVLINLSVSLKVSYNHKNRSVDQYIVSLKTNYNYKNRSVDQFLVSFKTR